jgi:cell division protein FtsQ
VTASTTALAHPRIRERLEAVEDEQIRRRVRKYIALGVLAFLVFLAFGITRSPLLDVDEVRVIGATTTGPNALRAVAGIEPGAPLVGLDLELAERRLLALPEVASVTSARTWDGLVTLEVLERRRVANITTTDGTLIVADDGMVVALTEVVDPMLPSIAGAMFTTPVGTMVPVELNDGLATAAALPSDIARVTDHIRVRSDNVSLVFVGGGIAEMGDARELEAKFDALRAFIAQVNLGCLESLDVRAPGVPVLARSAGC